MLPNANPAASDGKMAPEMMMLSMQESTLNYTQGMYEKLGNILTFLKVDDKEDDLRYQKEQNEKIEEVRETKRNAGAGLRDAATSVKDKALEIGKGVSLGGVLSTLLGGALLAAIFAPDKFDKIVQSIKEKVEEYGPSIMEGVGNYLSQLNFSDLVVTGILGVRGGIIFSLFKFAGNWLKEKLEGWLGTEFDGWFGENAGEIAGAAGLFATLMSGTTIKLITGLFSSSGKLIETGLLRAQHLLGAELGKGLTPKNLGIAGIAVAAGMMAKTAVNGIADWFTKKDFSEESNTAMGKAMTGLQEATPALAKVSGQALEFAAYGAALGSVFPVIGTAIGAAIGGLVGAVVGIFSLDDAEIQGFKDGMSKIWDAIIDGLFSGVANLLTGLPSWALPDGVKAFIEKYSDTQGMKEQETTEKNKSLEKYKTTEEEIASVMNENGMVDDKKLEALNKERKAEGLKPINSADAESIFRSTQQAAKAKQDLEEVKASPAKELEEIDNQILEKQNWVEEAKNKQKAEGKLTYEERRGELIDKREQEIEELSKRREKLVTMLYADGGDKALGGSQGSTTLSKPPHNNIDLISAEIRVGSMAAQSSSMQPVVIDGSSNPSFVNNSQTMVNASRTSIYESMRETFSLESVAGRRFSAFT